MRHGRRGIGLIGFNPRPPRRTGATEPAATRRRTSLFQSSPAPKDGRYHHPSSVLSAIGGFNPRPPRRTGATLAHGKWVHEDPVSILARPEGRALPRPPAPPSPHAAVSILARPEGRALLSHQGAPSTMLPFQSSPAPKDGRYAASGTNCANSLMFQSSPAPKDGRYPTASDWKRNPITFQSSPAPKDGRYDDQGMVGGTTTGFNPRPPRRTGATPRPTASSARSAVSILARPEGRALQH